NNYPVNPDLPNNSIYKAKKQKNAGPRIETPASYICSPKLTLRGLLPALCPSLFHCVGYALPALGTQLAFSRCRSGCGGSGILAAFRAARAGAGCGRSRPGQQCARLLQLQYLSIDLSNNTVN